MHSRFGSICLGSGSREPACLYASDVVLCVCVRLCVWMEMWIALVHRRVEQTQTIHAGIFSRAQPCLKDLNMQHRGVLGTGGTLDTFVEPAPVIRESRAEAERKPPRRSRGPSMPSYTLRSRSSRSRRRSAQDDVLRGSGQAARILFDAYTARLHGDASPLIELADSGSVDARLRRWPSRPTKGISSPWRSTLSTRPG